MLGVNKEVFQEIGCNLRKEVTPFLLCRFFTEPGLNMTAAVNMYLRTVIREHGIPFNLKFCSSGHDAYSAIDSTSLCRTVTAFRIVVIAGEMC